MKKLNNLAIPILALLPIMCTAMYITCQCYEVWLCGITLAAAVSFTYLTKNAK